MTNWRDKPSFGQLNLDTYTVAGAPTGALTGDVAYISNGAGGNPTVAVYDGTNWIRSDTGGTIAA